MCVWRDGSLHTRDVHRTRTALGAGSAPCPLRHADFNTHRLPRPHRQPWQHHLPHRITCPKNITCPCITCTGRTFLNPPEKALVTPHGPTRGRTTLIPAVDGDHFFFVGAPLPSVRMRGPWGRGFGGYVTEITRSNWNDAEEIGMALARG